MNFIKFFTIFLISALTMIFTSCSETEVSGIVALSAEKSSGKNPVFTGPIKSSDDDDDHDSDEDQDTDDPDNDDEDDDPDTDDDDDDLDTDDDDDNDDDLEDGN